MCVFDDTYYKITTTNYISKISLYTTFHMYSSGPWPLKILMFELLVTCEIVTYSWPWQKTRDSKYTPNATRTENWYQNLGGAPPGAGHAFPKQRHMRRGRDNLFLSGFFSLYDAIHGWMTERMNGWIEKASRKTTTTSFTICNNVQVVIWYKLDVNLNSYCCTRS